jgi:hypothetical protein
MKGETIFMLLLLGGAAYLLYSATCGGFQRCDGHNGNRLQRERIPIRILICRGPERCRSPARGRCRRTMDRRCNT